MTMTKGEFAWMLNQVILAMNDETAYYDSGWLYIYEDEMEHDDCVEWFDDEEHFDELMDVFIRVYKRWHKYGLYEANEDVLEFAHIMDDILNLPKIENIVRLECRF